MTSEAADIARRAAEIVQRHGQCKGVFYDQESRVCMWGALIEASGINVQTCRYTDITGYDQIRAELAVMFPDDASPTSLPGAASFNDLPETTERDVAKVLLQVADRLDTA